jgi:mycothiol synthase
VPLTIDEPPQLDARLRASVLALAEVVDAADGAPPLSDEARTQLGSDRVRHFVATVGTGGGHGELAGYAQLSATGAAELLGTPEAVAELIDRLIAQAAAANRPLEIWAHGNNSRLQPVLSARGFDQLRVLWQLRWPATPIEPVTLAEGVRLRPFEVGRDEAAWLEVNAAAFVHYPDQGGWTITELAAREDEPWFDPAGFLLAVNERDELLGFHWTKRHSPTLGEVYVIAVAPAAQGMALGKALLIAGLSHLVAGGATEVLLYVDDTNTSAIALYEKYGFSRYNRDVQYRLPAPS